MINMRNARVAAYAQYSTDKQQEVSLEDQLRRCQDVARSLGVSIDEGLIFTDSALTTAKKEQAYTRNGFNSLMKKWDEGEIDIIIADELSRLVRHPRQILELRERIEDTGVRLVTADGLDTERQNLEIGFALQGMVSDQFIRDTQLRVTRGMCAQLERGFMISTPPYGYSYRRIINKFGKNEGTEWYIDEMEANVVREIFEYRRRGLSFAEISKRLNDRDIQPPRPNKKTGYGYWRPGTVTRMLANPIYKGVFVYHGSSTYKKKLKQRKQEPEPQEFLRPHLRIVNDEI